MKATKLSASLVGLASLFSVTSCQQEEKTNPELKAKVAEYAPVELSSDLAAKLTVNEKKIVNLFFEIAQIADDIYWKQTFGDKSEIEKLTDPLEKQYAYIHYGAWDRLANNEPFLAGYGKKPDVCHYYPQDMTAQEFEALQDSTKMSWYTVIRRDEQGKLKSVWYHEEYAEEIHRMCDLMQQAADLSEDQGLKNYLEKRIKAFQTDEYLESDLAWMDMKTSNLDFVIGPIESYDDMFQETKTSYEAFILLKDVERSKNLAKFIAMLPDLQKQLPCAPKYKTFVPGTSSDLNVYDAVFYAGDCNAGGKTIAINLPNDDRVHEMKGTRRLQLRNAMKAKFDKIVYPIAKLILTPDQLKHLKFDAFFWNVTFHEVAHGLGVKQTVDTKQSVDEVMGTEKTSWEEGKADILGLFMVCKLVEMGEITNITQEDAIATFLSGLLRSVRFGAASAHGNANMMCFNYMQEKGAFRLNEVGKYEIDFLKARAAINSWADLILTTQGNGDVKFAREYRKKNCVISPELQQQLDKINGAGIPKDIYYIQGPDVLFK